MGNQGSSGGQFRRGVELIEDGVLGEIREVYIWNSGGGEDYKEPPEGEQPVPPYLKWDLWLGPIKERPFHASWLGWPHWREFGTGQIGMWGSHTSYLTFLALKIVSLWKAEPSAKPRIKVRAEVSGINRLSFPQWEKVDFQIPARGELPPVTIHWVNGGGVPGWKQKLDELVGNPADWGDAKEQEKGKEQKPKWSDFAGAVLVGSKGRMHSTGHNYTIDLLPAKQFEDVDTQAPEASDQLARHARAGLAAGGPRRHAVGRPGPTSAAPVPTWKCCCWPTWPRSSMTNWSTIRWRARSSTTRKRMRCCAARTAKAGRCREQGERPSCTREFIGEVFSAAQQPERQG